MELLLHRIHGTDHRVLRGAGDLTAHFFHSTVPGHHHAYCRAGRGPKAHGYQKSLDFQSSSLPSQKVCPKGRGDIQKGCVNFMGTLFKNADFVDPIAKTITTLDVLIEDDRIARMEKYLPEAGHQVIDLSGKYLCPGLVDMHVHFRDPGLTYKEDIRTGSQAAAAGGFTSVCCMPNTKPVLDTPELLNYVNQRSAEAGFCRVYPIAAVTHGQAGEALTDFSAMAAAGAIAFSDDGVPVTSAKRMRDALLEAKQLDKIVISHCEDAEMVKNYGVNEGEVSKALGLPGRPAIAEDLMVARDLMLAAETGGHVHIAHVSTKGSAQLIREAKDRGIPVTAETCPQYFMYTEQELLKKGTQARVNPPLRTEADRQTILDAVLDGTLDCIVTDHAPHSPEEKARPLPEAPSGMVGLETSLSACFTGLVVPGHLTMPELIYRMTAAPAAILGLSVSRSPGDIANLTVFDPEPQWTVEPERFFSKGRSTVFAGETLWGQVTLTMLAGAVTFRR